MYLVFKNERLAPDVMAQPEIDLYQWRIVQRSNGSLHITTQIASGTLRVTSALLAIELSQGRIKTESGRCYRLCTPPETDQLVLFQLYHNAVREIGVVSGDISEPIWKAISSGAWASDDKCMLPAIQ